MIGPKLLLPPCSAASSICDSRIEANEQDEPQIYADKLGSEPDKAASFFLICVIRIYPVADSLLIRKTQGIWLLSVLF